MWQRSKEPLIVVLVLLLLPVAARFWTIDSAESPLFPIAIFLPFLFFTIAAFTASKLGQGRTTMTCGCFILCLLLIHTQWISKGPLEIRVPLALIALPLALFVLYLIRDARLLHFRTFAMAIASTSVFLGLASAQQEGALSFIPLFTEAPGGWNAPSTAICLGLLFAVQSFLVKDPDARSTHVFTALALIPSFYGLHRIHIHSPESTQGLFEAGLSFAVAGSLIAYSVFMSYWRKIYIDDLTALPNRRALEEALRSLQGGYAIAMIDIDHFKRFNDTYGHQTGDDVLSFVSKQFSRTKDPRIFRYGGEEFCAIFKHLASSEAAARHMDELRQMMEQKKFYIRDRKKRDPQPQEEKGPVEPIGEEIKKTTILRITISVGVASKTESLKTPEKVLAAADAALYTAKEMGRNQVVSA